MGSQFGLTVDQAVAQLAVAEKITNDAERRAEYRRILGLVRSLGYHDGSEDERVGYDG